MTSPGIPEHLHHAIAQLCAHYGWTTVGEPQPVAGSILNTNVRIETAEGPRFVRIAPERRQEPLLRLEHDAMRFVTSEGIPVPTPIADASGETLHTIDGLHIAVLPWIDGHTLQRGHITPEQAAILGDMQGRTQAALATFQHPALARSHQVIWDTAASVTTFSSISGLLRGDPALRQEYRAVQHHIRTRLALLTMPTTVSADSDFEALPSQPCHGDFHAGNLMLNDSGHIVAIVDWELVAIMPRIYDLYRALAYALWDEPAAVEAWVAAYARHVQLTRAECELGVELWWQHTLHSAWAYAEVFLRNNPGPRIFFEENDRHLTHLRDAAWRSAHANRIATAAGV